MYLPSYLEPAVYKLRKYIYPFYPASDRSVYIIVPLYRLAGLEYELSMLLPLDHLVFVGLHNQVLPQLSYAFGREDA